MMVRDFQSVIGEETKQQCLEQIGRLPDVVVACVGGGSNSAGMFYPFVDDADVELVGVEAGGRGHDARRARRHAQPRPARRAARQLQLRPAGRRRPDRRRAFGLGRPGLSRRRPRAQLLEGHAAGCATRSVSDDGGARRLSHLCGRLEGILPALETAHAVVEAMRDRRDSGRRTRRGRDLLLRPRRQGLLRGGPTDGEVTIV